MLGRGAERWLCFPSGWQGPQTPDVPSSGSEIENEECNASASWTTISRRPTKSLPLRLGERSNGAIVSFREHRMLIFFQNEDWGIFATHGRY